jgi:hypothetical protein
MRQIRTFIALFIGLSLIAGIASAVAAMVAKGRLESHGSEADDEFDLVTIYSGRDFVSTAPALRRGSVLTWYGGGTVDLRGATLAPDAELRLRALFGGIRLVVPETWRIQREAIAVFGGIGDARDVSAIAPDGPTLRITGWAAFGGVGIVSEAPDLDTQTEPVGEPVTVAPETVAAPA